jgi:hypothetical protein
LLGGPLLEAAESSGAGVFAGRLEAGGVANMPLIKPNIAAGLLLNRPWVDE